MVTGVCEVLVGFILVGLVRTWGLTLVCTTDDPGGRVTNAQVEDFPRRDELVERGHHFFDGSAEVPPVDVQLETPVSLNVQGRLFFQLTRSI